MLSYNDKNITETMKLLLNLIKVLTMQVKNLNNL